MMRKNLFLTIIVFVSVAILISGCGAEATPDPSIVWSEDFEDGDTEEWTEHNPGIFFTVDEGVLTAGPDRAGDISHESSVSHGTWSFDVFYPEEENKIFEVCLCCDEAFRFGFGMDSFDGKNTILSVLTLTNGSKETVNHVNLGRKLSGWNHFDITRDESGNSAIYLNGELILEYQDELPISSSVFYFNTSNVGPAFDNLVVRNKVIDIRSTK